MINKYSDFYEFMLEDLPRCPEPLKLQQLKQAFREFAFRTENWTATLDKVNLVADQQDYTLRLPQDGLVKRLVWVNISDAAMPTNQYELRNEYSLRWKKTPVSYVPTYSLDDGLQVRVAMYPDWDSRTVDENYFTRWGDAILNLALYRLLMMPGKTWTHPELAVQKKDIYDVFYNDAIKEKYTEGKSGSLSVNLRPVTRRFA